MWPRSLGERVASVDFMEVGFIPSTVVCERLGVSAWTYHHGIYLGRKPHSFKNWIGQVLMFYSE